LIKTPANRWNVAKYVKKADIFILLRQNDLTLFISLIKQITAKPVTFVLSEKSNSKHNKLWQTD